MTQIAFFSIDDLPSQSQWDATQDVVFYWTYRETWAIFEPLNSFVIEEFWE
jgi:hypothetical protein